MSRQYLKAYSRRQKAVGACASQITPVGCLQVSACGELARLGLVAGSPAPAAATSLYDWDLATAALAASHAVRHQLDAMLVQSRQSTQPPSVSTGGCSTESIQSLPCDARQRLTLVDASGRHAPLRQKHAYECALCWSEMCHCKGLATYPALAVDVSPVLRTAFPMGGREHVKALSSAHVPEGNRVCCAEPGAPSTGSTAGPARKGFGGFLSQVKDAASKVVDDTSKNLNQASLLLSSTCQCM